MGFELQLQLSAAAFEGTTSPPERVVAPEFVSVFPDQLRRFLLEFDAVLVLDLRSVTPGTDRWGWF